MFPVQQPQPSMVPAQTETPPPQITPVEPPRPASSPLNHWQDVLPGDFSKGEGEPDEKKISDLSMDVYRCVNGAIKARELILDRIEVNERFYHNRPAKAVTLEPYPGAPNYHIPLVGPRLQQRKASWVDTITSPDKYFYVTYLGSDETGPDGETITADEIEDAVQCDLQFLMKAANFEQCVLRIGETMYPTGIAMVWTTFHEHPRGAEWSALLGPYAGFRFEVIHPNFFLTFPANYPSLLKQRIAGHQFEMRVEDVQSKIRNQIWMDAKVIGSNQSLRSQRQDPGIQQDGTVGRLEDQPVKLGDFLMRYQVDDDTDEKFYRVIADTEHMAVYRIEPYDDGHPWYTAFRIYEDLNAFWPEDSPANDGQSANMMLNALINNGLWGIQYASRQSVLGKGMPGQDSMQNLPPGAYIPVSAIAETQTISSNFSMAGIDFMAEFTMRIADIAMKVPDTISGGSAKDETATAQQIKYQGFQLMGGADIDATNPSFVQLAQVCLNLMYENWAAISRTYGPLGVLKIKNREWLRKPMYISVAGQKPKAAPQIQQQELAAALKLIMMNPALAQNLQLMLELTQKFVNQTSIEGKEDIIKAISSTTADMGQWNQITNELKQMGVTPQMAVQLIQTMAGGTPTGNQPGGGNIKQIMNFGDVEKADPAAAHQMEVNAGIAHPGQGNGQS